MITLIPNSGVQFITKEVNLSDDKLNKFRPFEYYEEKDEEEEDEDVFLFKLPYYLSRISSYIEKAPSESGNTVINAEAINVETWEIMDEEKILDRVFRKKRLFPSLLGRHWNALRISGCLSRIY